MLNLPIVKFEKSCNYLNEQLTLQNNNKQLILDIISNIGIILNESDEKFEQYDIILETANEFLKSLSTNITSIEQLNVEIKNITAELTSLLSEQNKASKTKEFYIAAFSNIKHNIIVYSKKFQELENTLTIDNNRFNEFINENNFKYNFVSIENSTNTYTFTGFSINDTEEISNNNDNNNEINDIVDTTDDNLIENSENDTSEENEVVENNIENEVLPIDTTLENVEEESSEKLPENIDKIEELTNEFKSLLLNISENNINDATSSVVSLFKEILPAETSTSLTDFLNLENTEENINDDVNEVEETEEIVIDNQLFVQMMENYIISDLESIIFEKHNGLIYEYNEEFDGYISYEKTIEVEQENNTEAIEVEQLINTEIIEEEVINEPIIPKTDEYSSIEENLSSSIELDVTDNIVLEENSLEVSTPENSDILLLDALLENSEYLSTDAILEKLEELEKNEESNNLIEEIEIIDENNNNEESIEEIIDEQITFENEEVLLQDDPLLSSDIENNEELFVEDLNDVNEDVENANDIEILIDNIETIENVEKSIFEELNNDDSNLADISFDSILENTEFSFDTTDISIEDFLDDESEENSSINDDSTVELSIEENDIIDNNVITEDLLNTDIDNELLANILDENIANEIISEKEAFDEIIDQDEIDFTSTEISLEDLDLLDNIAILDKDITESIDSSVQTIDEDNQAKEIESVEQIPQEEEKNIEHFYKDNANDDSGFKNKGLSKKEFDEKLLKIENALEDNKTLVISERLQKIYLPYKVSELNNYIESYPGSYNALKDVVAQEFTLPFNYFRKHPTKARFTEAYNLLKNREGRNFMKSVSYAFRLLNKNNLNPAIIASCKTQHELDSYLYYLDSDNLNNFKFFDIIYEVNPM